MLKHDPLAPLINAEVADRLRSAEQARLRRAAAQARLNHQLASTRSRGPLAQLLARTSRPWSSLIHLLRWRGSPAPESQPEK
ncbi:MAG TPA: hypothetical protein VNL71_24385 [Chloroflexota bacterium]|nr:hypothetical protein [Chloroflexota bacterium]